MFIHLHHVHVHVLHVTLLCFADDIHVQNKNLPNWLRKELEELELKKMKDRESEREQFKRRKRSINMKSWKEEMAEDEEREFNEEDLPPYKQKKRVVVDSKEVLDCIHVHVCTQHKMIHNFMYMYCTSVILIQ